MPFGKGYLILYMITFILVAIPLTWAGALIPYLASDLGIDQTEYSLLFVFSSIGSILATLIYKLLEHYHRLPKHHTICFIALYIGAAGCLAMYFMHTRISQCLMFLVFDLFCYFILIAVNVSLLKVAPADEIGMWVGFSHGAFGVGALIGPLLVPIFKFKLFIIMAALLVILAPFFFFLSSPSDIQAEKEENNQVHHAQQSKSRQGSLTIEIMISLAFFVLIGIQVTIPSWSPTYAIKNGINDKQGATKFSSIFWILSTIFRFIFGWLKIKQSTKLKILIGVQLFSGFVCTIVATLELRQLAIYLCSILYGIGISHIFPLLLSTPSEFGIILDDSQISTMMFSQTISAGTFSFITGVLMKDRVDMFFYSIVGFSLLLTVCAFLILKYLSEDEQRHKEKGHELKEQQP